jgi:hypothetical protein
MDTDDKIAVLVQTVSQQSGQIDALATALLSMLHLAKGTPGLREVIEQQLEHNYSGLLARSENSDYVAGFERLRDLIAIALKA